MPFFKRNLKLIIAGIIAFAIMALICFLLYDPMLNFIKDADQLKASLNEYGIFGGLILSLIMAAQVVFIFLPGEIIEVMAGYVYGPMNGMLFCLVGAAIGSIIIYLFVARFGIRFIRRFISEEKMRKMIFLKDHKNLNIILFIIFFIPGTPKDIITYMMPLTDMKLSTFLVITSVARIPSVISSTIGGNALGLQQYKFTILVFAITGLFSCIGLYFYKHKIQCSKHIDESLENL